MQRRVLSFQAENSRLPGFGRVSEKETVSTDEGKRKGERRKGRITQGDSRLARKVERGNTSWREAQRGKVGETEGRIEKSGDERGRGCLIK